MSIYSRFEAHVSLQSTLALVVAVSDLKTEDLDLESWNFSVQIRSARTA